MKNFSLFQMLISILDSINITNRKERPGTFLEMVAPSSVVLPPINMGLYFHGKYPKFTVKLECDSNLII
jgi:hypothetical protein